VLYTGHVLILGAKELWKACTPSKCLFFMWLAILYQCWMSNTAIDTATMTPPTALFAPNVWSSWAISCLAAPFCEKSGSQSSTAVAGATRSLHSVTHSPVGGFMRESGSPRLNAGHLIRWLFASRDVCGFSGMIVFRGATKSAAVVTCVAWDMLQDWCKEGIVVRSMLLGE
jgi:hypothetical protein